mmetsp:Transcript_11332/g.38322  ORF Transcript_11332/g.38322 Transcript_11332/m.38322 type:complete len:338 (-) Transcript_11332:1362-2375(-)
MARLLVVPEEVAKEAAGRVIREEHEEILGELKGRGELFNDEPQHVQELQENGAALLAAVIAVAVPEAVVELVAEGGPLLLHENREAVDGAHKGVQQDLCHGADLRRAVPPVRAVHEHGRALELELLGRQHGAREDHAQVAQPARLEHPAADALVLARGPGQDKVLQSGVAAAHGVDVVNVAEENVRVLVVLHVLRAPPAAPVQRGRQGAAAVHHGELLGEIGVLGLASQAQEVEELLVRAGCLRRHAHHGLRRPCKHGATRGAVGDGGKALLGAEGEGALEVGLGERRGNCEARGVRLHKAEVRVVQQPPVLRRQQAHALELALHVQHVPAAQRGDL